MELGLVNKIDINKEMQQSYLDYAMSVIVSRALPDARDGLKPVQRRILYAMYDMGLRADSSHKKSARIVGEVLGKYHPHGDSSVYEAMARQAQDFSMRYMLVDGQGNFGSVDGDPPAAMRYTEARLAMPALDMLAEINKETVDFTGNFDDTLTEPSVLPSAIPNLLVNGGSGIAVGMSTSIPPHNLSEVVDALNYMLASWGKLDDISVGDLMEFVKGPDFPTGGLIIQEKDSTRTLESAYGSGKGRVTLQAKVHVEEMGRNKSRLIVTELPYAVNKAKLISKIAALVRDGKIDGITDLRDESDRQGMRMVIELTKNVEPENVLEKLYSKTPMRSTFSIIMLALVDGEPRTLSLKQALRVFLEHRLEIIRRRSEYDLRKAEERAHILEGYLVAIKNQQNLDAIISLIRNAADVPTARKRLMKKFKLSTIQAQAILDMPLRRLAGLERKKIKEEYSTLSKIIKDLKALLKSPKKMRDIVSEELGQVKETYGDSRRTRIITVDADGDKSALLTSADLLPEKSVWVGVTADGLVSRTPDDKSPRPSGKEAPKWLVKVNTTDTLYLVSEKGKCVSVAAHTIPEATKLSGGTLWHKVSPLKPSEKLALAFSLPAKRSELPEESYILTVTRGGMVKKSAIADLPGPSAQSYQLLRVNDGDVLGWTLLTDGKKDILLATSSGMGIRFSEDDVRVMGLVAAGVNGIKLGVGELVVGAELLPQKYDEIFIITSEGNGKRILPSDFPKQGRYGKGVILWKLPAGERLAGLAVGKYTQTITLHLLKLSAKAARIDAAPSRKRATTRGGLVQEVKLGDAIIGLTMEWDVERFVDKVKK
ncbi:MAG: DNA topoisomerase 4 subunit A [Anaerolineae bacterium]|jgi:DNA gyrase subunit A|nr:DNA topoisomerase 4 subunit A [Anaerolineae bacterium]MBT7073446.1 DNA topoisomerase 4 subunit A [Anaerolineae bacterium]